jgi:hypothetical protein
MINGLIASSGGWLHQMEPGKIYLLPKAFFPPVCVRAISVLGKEGECL